MTRYSGIFTSRALPTLLASMLFLAGCGGESTEQLPNDGADNTTSSYSGPIPATDDVANFKREFWDKLREQPGGCGDCHSNAGGQSPKFMNEDDINAAYAQANTVVNLSEPAQSPMIAKVADNHNCWASSTNVCVDILTTYIANWANNSEGSVKTVELSAPEIKDVGNTLAFPETSSAFETHIYPTLTEYCSDCHTGNGQTPYIASANPQTAYEQAKSRIDLNDSADVTLDEASSRLVERLRDDQHNCWDADCDESAMTMLAAIQNFVATLGEPEPIPENLIVSKALTLNGDGLEANSGGRFEDNVIALYEFKTGEGQTAFDTSGVLPALDMTLSGNVGWVGGWGVEFGPSYQEDGATIRAGKAQGSTDDSSKLHNLLTASGEYSIEAWVVPGNTVQEDARIVTYSGSATARNFTLGQTEQLYDVLHRSTTSDQNAPFSTENNPMLLQATLQHVVVNYSPGKGREIFVNGQPTGDIDPDEPGLLTDWDNTFALVFGNETDGNSPWEGALRMVAIHNRALTPEQVQANYDVGVGQKFFLLFSVSHLIDGMEQSFIVFEVSQFDNFSYLFSNPFYIDLDDSKTPSGVRIQGMRIGINGREPAVGQAFANLDVTLGSPEYQPGSGQPLSPFGTVIGLENGPDVDEFFLTFENLDGNRDVRVESDLGPQPEPADLDQVSTIGIKTFDEVNASMSRVTGIPTTEPRIYETFIKVKQQLPTVENIGGFLSSHQMAITQMAIQYCDVLVADEGRRNAFFPEFDFSQNAATAFDDIGQSQVTGPLLTAFVGVDLDTQPANLDIEDELGSLMVKLSECGGSCPDGRSETVVKASCAAVLGSAVTLIQ
ncbi:LamG domain-containing protein [Marinobacter confluentis]|nr:LamG domain-containing protein [Marinobacter confluentis]